MTRFVGFDRSLKLIGKEVLAFGLVAAKKRAILRYHEQKIYSQNGEDGLLAYIFSRISTTSRRFVEIGCENGIECNTAHLSLNGGWSGVLIDANETYIAQGVTYYQQLLGAHSQNVTLRQALVTAENINAVVANCVGEAIDLVSIDVDGIDYYLWQALTVLDPRVVVIEYNGSLPPTRSVTVRYHPSHERFSYHPSGYYHGASLAALTKLAASKDYVLAGCDSEGVNAFFVKKELVANRLPTLTPAQAYYPCRIRMSEMSLMAQYATTGSMDFVSV